ncbi:MAG: hypothetical protein HOL07_05030 [Rhodospirillaceae bacterium]|jgi:hypothetical protein|nr:hypothetical protein [Rhodospirillaceae bacterium]MBT5357692.1 hypothetical protein [Rhodospirillaceae bacterium]MBT5768876.1 hypothetical protein [Rhodospirillaceae bacterium]MBT6308928.1 hypothetical protein [Rhodospirillaceae bacterium]
MLDRSTKQSAARLLYFDEQPSSCMRAIDAADDMRLPIETVSHPDALNDACRTFKPSAVLAVLHPGDMQARRVIAVISVAGPQLPVLVAGEVDISLDEAIGTDARALDLYVRGSVRLGGSLRDLQLALLCAISRLRGGPIT